MGLTVPTTGAMTLLWKEDSPASFSTKNIFVGDLSNYDLVLIVYYVDTRYKDSLSTLMMPNNGTILSYNTYPGTGVFGLSRVVTYEDGNYSVAANKVDGRNDVLLPTKIYGIKI